MQGCIREQDLHHTCGANSDLETAHAAHCEGGRHRSPALSPLDLSTQSSSRQSPVVPQHRDKVPIMYQDYHPHHQNTVHEIEEHMPLDPILKYVCVKCKPEHGCKMSCLLLRMRA